jgi:hypothetical protein
MNHDSGDDDSGINFFACVDENGEFYRLAITTKQLRESDLGAGLGSFCPDLVLESLGSAKQRKKKTS